jgi:hypothetical protein
VGGSRVRCGSSRRSYARAAPRGEIKTYDVGHFDFYLGEPFEALVRDQIEFLTRHLAPVGKPVGAVR